MEAFYFGDRTVQLFGAYHPPSDTSLREEAVLICPAIGHEYMRTHWALRQVAGKLSSSGFHVLRFDYQGTGDSGGEFEDTSFETWLDNCTTALNELRDMSSATRIHLLGVRLGGTLAALLGQRMRESHSLVLWEPVIHGDNFIDELKTLHQERYQGTPKAYRNFAADELMGYLYTSDLRQELREISLLQLKEFCPSRLLICSSRPNEAVESLCSLVAACGGDQVVRSHTDSAFGDWEDPLKSEEALLPGPVQSIICDFLSEQR